MSCKTVLYDKHTALGGRLVDFHGWVLPVQYEGILAEHRHCRAAACLFDTCHMGQILICTSCPEAISLVLTQDAPGLQVGKAAYGFLLNEAGGIIDDTVLMRLGEKEFLLVVNAGTAEGDYRWVGEHLKSAAEIVNRSAEGWAKIDLQGPQAARILSPLTNVDLTQLGYFRVTTAKVCGKDCILSRTGYTGELGYEMFAPGDAIVEMFDAILSDRQARPAGLGARDSLRLEMCYPLHGQDIDPGTNPIEAGLGFFLKSQHDHIGSQAVRRIAAAGPGRRLVGFACETRRRCSTGDRIMHQGRQVGTVTSGAFSPSLEVSIGMGYVSADLAGPGQDLEIATDRAFIPAKLVEKPIYKQGTCRTKQLL